MVQSAPFFKIDESSESTEFTLGMMLALACLALSYMLSYLAMHRLHWTFVSEAAVALLIGISAGGVLKLIGRTESFQISVFYDVLLPPIIFSSGYSMSRRWFFANIYKILAFSIIGTCISTALTGVFLWGLSQTPALTVDLSIKESLAFGSLISATDPVTTLAIFQELKVESQLFYVIFGESVFNDAVAIVLFETLKETLTGEVISIELAIGKFFFVFLSSMIVGCILGCISAMIMKYARLRELTVEIVVVLIFCYFPYLVGQVFSMSGIVAILFTGITMKHYTHRNMSPEAADLSEIAISLTASISETFVFLNLGTSVWTMSGVNLSFVCWGILVILIARAGQVYPLSWILNCFERNTRARLEPKQMHMLWYSGLRGAIAYALAVDFPEESKNHEVIKSTTMMLVLITILTFGTATVPMLKLLGIRRKSTGSHNNKSGDDDLESKVHRPDSALFLKLTPHCKSLLEFDREYIQPCLVRTLSLIHLLTHFTYLLTYLLNQVRKERIGKKEDDITIPSARESHRALPTHLSMRLLGHVQQKQEEENTTQDSDDEEDVLLQNCGNRGSIRSLGRVGGRWWMRSLRLPSNQASYRNLTFTELREAAESVLRKDRPRFATRSMLIKLLEDSSTEKNQESDLSTVQVSRPLPPPPK